MEPLYKDEIDCLKQLVVKEGPASLYSGLVPQLIGIAPEKVVRVPRICTSCHSLRPLYCACLCQLCDFVRKHCYYK